MKGKKETEWICQWSYVLMCDLGEIMIRSKYNVGILQNPFVREGEQVYALPDGFPTYRDLKVLIVIVDATHEGMDTVRCIWISRGLMRLYGQDVSVDKL